LFGGAHRAVVLHTGNVRAGLFIPGDADLFLA
jgi:hypothetical protein